MEAVSTSAFGRSLVALERAVEVYERLKAGDLRVTARNSVILEFEICYGQTRPLLERGLIEMSGESPSDLGSMTFRSLIQLANERGFSKYGVEDWLSFREMRNRTAHAYSEPLQNRSWKLSHSSWLAHGIWRRTFAPDKRRQND